MAIVSLNIFFVSDVDHLRWIQSDFRLPWPASVFRRGGRELKVWMVGPSTRGFAVTPWKECGESTSRAPCVHSAPPAGDDRRPVQSPAGGHTAHGPKRQTIGSSRKPRLPPLPRCDSRDVTANLPPYRVEPMEPTHLTSIAKYWGPDVSSRAGFLSKAERDRCLDCLS